MRFLDTSGIRTRFDERVVMADGAELSVDIYLPREAGRYPVLLNRTAADNNRFGRVGISLPPAERWKALAAQGFIVAAADVRGRGDSDGRFTPFVCERADGAATVAWLRKLPECNGRIGMFGSGYGGFCAWAAAVGDGHVDAIASISPFGAVGRGLFHRGGAVRLDWLFWMHLFAGRSVQPANMPPWPTIHKHLPLATMDEALGREDIWWQEWLRHLDASDLFWAPLDLAEEIAALSTVGLHVTGWWDGQASAAHYFYEAACRSRAPQKRIIGPWDTCTVRNPSQQVGGFDFGPRSVIDLDETLADFFSACLRANTPDSSPQSRVFVTGVNEWVSLESGSTGASSAVELYASSRWGANTRRGDGLLCPVPASQSGVDRITHNPSVPVDFQPQFVSFAAGANALDFTLDQAHITSRDEALVYTSEPLRAPVTVWGRPRVTLTVRTAAADADLYVLLSDSFPFGLRDLHLGHAAVRLGSLSDFRRDEWMTIELELDEMAHDFLVGHQIRLSITPSLFPLYARNLHVDAYSQATIPVVAQIELRHGRDSPLCLKLPRRLKS